MLDRIGNWIKRPFAVAMSDEDFRRQRREILQKTPVPVTWMFGKTGSGKSSVVRYLTGSESARIGSGFRPETKQSFRYNFPHDDNPVLSFLDTRGLGETEYDPVEDIARFDDEAHVVLVTVRILDNALDALLKPLRTIRKAKRTRPVLLLLTCLHEAYPQQQHPSPDPFRDSDCPQGLPAVLTTALMHQRNRFEGLADSIVPLDLTHPNDGFDEPNFGGARMKKEIIAKLPDIFRQTFVTLDDVMGSLKNLHERKAAPYITSAGLMAATAAAVPVPWIDLPVVAGIQSDLIRRLSTLYGQPMDMKQFLKMSGAVSGPMMARQAVRETLKFMPGIGSVANAALAFATTFALGKACCWYFGEILAGHAPTTTELRQVMGEQMNVAKTVWERRNASDSRPEI